jgi:hypothetical protein
MRRPRIRALDRGRTNREGECEGAPSRSRLVVRARRARWRMDPRKRAAAPLAHDPTRAARPLADEPRRRESRAAGAWSHAGIAAPGAQTQKARRRAAGAWFHAGIAARWRMDLEGEASRRRRSVPTWRRCAELAHGRRGRGRRVASATSARAARRLMARRLRRRWRSAGRPGRCAWLRPRASALSSQRARPRSATRSRL